MSTSNSVEERLYICNCSKYCRSEPTKVSRSAYYRHAPYRNTLPPIPAELVAAHHGVPLPHSSATSAPSIPLLRPLDPQEGSSEPPRRRRRTEAVEAPTSPTPGLSTENSQGSERLGATEGFGETGDGGLDGLEADQHCDERQATPDAPAARLSEPPRSQHAPLPRPYEYAIPADFEPKIDDLRTALAFQRALENASLENGDLDEDDLYLLRNPPATPLVIDDRDVLLSIKLFISTSNASDQTYKNIYKDLSQDSPERNFLSHARVKKKLAELTGVYAIVNDMCPNSCIAYTGPFAVLEVCVYCQAPRYSQDQPGKQALQHFYTLPLGPQLQALWRTILGARAMKYRERRTREILEKLLKDGELLEYDDICHGMDYLMAYLRGDIKPEDMVLMFATDGAQLYVDKQSDCWVYIWVILDLPPELRYKKRLILPGGFIPGPNNPKHTVSFFFSGFQHLAALQKEGLKIWDAEEDRTFVSRPFLLLGGADGPGSVHFTGLVGHHGAYPCRLFCGVKGRHKPGGPQYYPALQKPDGYDVDGCCHPDIDPSDIRSGGIEAYQQKLEFLLGSGNISEYKTRRRDTGITTLSLNQPSNPYQKDLGGEINQPSNPYQNLSERGLRRCQVNALKSSYPAFQEDEASLPQYSEDIGNGYAFLRAKERTPHFLQDPLEADAVKRYFIQQEALHGNSPDDDWQGAQVTRWARLRLPNGQTARSTWKEERAKNNSRRASCVKIQLANKYEYAEVKFYFYGSVNEERQTLVLVHFFSEPDPNLLQDSYNTVRSVTYLPKASGLRVLDAKSIVSVVAVIPHTHKIGNETQQRYFIWEQMGMETALQIDLLPDEIDNEEL